MIRALLYNHQTKQLTNLDAQQILASMPDEGENQNAAADAGGSSEADTPPDFGKLTGHCRRGELMWIDIEAPSDEDFALLARRFKLHPLVLEDIKSVEGRPKLHDYGEYLYLIFHAVSAGEGLPEGGDAEVAVAGNRRFDLSIAEVDCLVGRDYVLTIHAREVAPFRALYNRWQRTPTLMELGAGHLLYEILDEVLDDYFPVLDALDERIDDFEDRLFLQWQDNLSADIFNLKRSLLQIRRIAGPTRDIVNILLRHDADSGGKHFVYLQDLYDHSSRIVDSVDTYRDLLSGALDAYLAIASNRMNEIMKTLTSASIILLIPTLIAGIYGMNFENMPELHSRYGYHATLAAMGAIIVALTVYFKKKRWL